MKLNFKLFLTIVIFGISSLVQAVVITVQTADDETYTVEIVDAEKKEFTGLKNIDAIIKQVNTTLMPRNFTMMLNGKGSMISMLPDDKILRIDLETGEHELLSKQKGEHDQDDKDDKSASVQEQQQQQTLPQEVASKVVVNLPIKEAVVPHQTVSTTKQTLTQQDAQEEINNTAQQLHEASIWSLVPWKKVGVAALVVGGLAAVGYWYYTR